MKRQNPENESKWFAVSGPMAQENNKSKPIHIYGRISDDEYSARTLIDQINELPETVETLDVHINTNGGSVDQGLAIYQNLMSFPGAVNTYIEGVVASIGSVIAMAGVKGEINMAPSALLMVHNPFMNYLMEAKEGGELRKDAETLDKMKGVIINAFSHSRYSNEEFSQLMDAKTWFDAEEALEAGLIHKITGELNAAAVLEWGKFGALSVPDRYVDKLVDAKNSATVDFRNGTEQTLLEKYEAARLELKENQAEISSLKEVLNAVEKEAEVKREAYQLAIEEAKKFSGVEVSRLAASLLAEQGVQALGQQPEDGVKETDSEAILREYETIKTKYPAGTKIRDDFFNKHKDVLAYNSN